ncbi:hypothetical protein PoB_001253100 [Plakobranchus ocellatus]|uniref:DET1- and DDB1-associated protein 1 n=1 Tax=Plakobranchus ocellatus TaxID=259542 RepID=A0AAV3YRS7_9GAST|nr:hypothetical protein PoB_001253100 [Plakobranchus ocellatus]
MSMETPTSNFYNMSQLHCVHNETKFASYKSVHRERAPNLILRHRNSDRPASANFEAIVLAIEPPSPQELQESNDKLNFVRQSELQRKQ